MIEKFISLKNIGQFKNYNCSGDVVLKNLSLIYGENGCGKTTICSILRSLKTGNKDYISERKSLGVSDSSSVKIKINNEVYTFGDNSWDNIYKDIEIFDSKFISDNVYSGDSVDFDHKKNLYRVIVGR